MQEVEQQKPGHKAHPGSGDWPGRQGDPQHGSQLRPESRRRREDKAGERDIEDPDTDIAEAAAQRRELTAAPRTQEFREANNEEAAENDGKGDQGCLPRRVSG
jgi:hypothetical protein